MNAPLNPENIDHARSTFLVNSSASQPTILDALSERLGQLEGVLSLIACNHRAKIMDDLHVNDELLEKAIWAAECLLEQATALSDKITFRHIENGLRSAQ